MSILKIVLFAIALGLLSGCAGIVVSGGGVMVSDGHVSIAFSSDDRAIIARYYRTHVRSKTTPPGLAKRRGALPHGLAKRDVLPRGLRGRRLPADLERQLSVVPKGHTRAIIGTSIVLMNNNTRVVMDIYRDAIR